MKRYIYGTSLAATYRYQNAVKSGYTYYVQNAHGDVVNLTDAEGAVTRTYRYDAFGVEFSPVSGDVNVFRYCGEYFDTETGTVYLRARYYQASIGRFTQRDTVAGKLSDPLSLNLYTYAHNNPIFYFDPSGHTVKEFWECVKETYHEEKDTWKVGAKDWLTSHKEGLKDVVNWTSDKKGALSISIVFSCQVSNLTYSGSIGGAIDAKGNLALTKVTSFSMHTNGDEKISGSIDFGSGFYYVDSVNDLSGFGIDFGVSGVPYNPALSLAMDEEQNVTAWGITASQTLVSTSPSDNVDAYIQWDNTQVDTGFIDSEYHYNLYDYLDYLDDYLLRKLYE